MKASRTKWLISLIGLGVLGAPLGALYIFASQDSASIDRSMATLRRYGYEPDIRRLNASIPSEENAATLYTKLIAELDAKPLLADWKIADHLALSAPQVALLRRERAFIDCVDDVRQRPNLWFSVPRNQAVGEFDRKSMAMVTLARLVGQLAILDVKEGHLERALKRIETLSAIANHLDQIPTWGGSWDATSVWELRVLTLIRMASVRKDLVFLKRLKDALRQPPFPPRRNHLGAYAALVLNDPKFGDTGVADWLSTSAVGVRRAQALQLELFARAAELAHDGVQTNDHVELDNLWRDQDDRFFRVNQSIYRWPSMLFDGLRRLERFNTLQPASEVVLAVMIQDAGGPVADLKHFKLVRKGDQFAVHDPVGGLTVAPGRARWSDHKYDLFR